MHCQCTLWVDTMLHLLGRVLMSPGNLVSDALGAQNAEDRMMIRTLINMLVWNLVIVIAVVCLY